MQRSTRFGFLTILFILVVVCEARAQLEYATGICLVNRFNFQLAAPTSTPVELTTTYTKGVIKPVLLPPFIHLSLLPPHIGADCYSHAHFYCQWVGFSRFPNHRMTLDAFSLMDPTSSNILVSNVIEGASAYVPIGTLRCSEDDDEEEEDGVEDAPETMPDVILDLSPEDLDFWDFSRVPQLDLTPRPFPAIPLLYRSPGGEDQTLPDIQPQPGPGIITPLLLMIPAAQKLIWAVLFSKARIEVKPVPSQVWVLIALLGGIGIIFFAPSGSGSLILTLGAVLLILFRYDLITPEEFGRFKGFQDFSHSIEGNIGAYGFHNFEESEIFEWKTNGRWWVQAWTLKFDSQADINDAVTSTSRPLRKMTLSEADHSSSIKK